VDGGFSRYSFRLRAGKGDKSFYDAADENLAVTCVHEKGGEGGPHLREAVPYEIKGPEDTNSIHTIKVSDEMIRQLLK
jgi:hypothetical protein